MERRNLNRLRHVRPHSDTLWDSGEAHPTAYAKAVPVGRRIMRESGAVLIVPAEAQETGTGDLAVAPHIRFADLDGVIVILDLETSRYALLDEAATIFWYAVCRRQEPLEVVERIAAEFGVPQDQVQADRDEFIASCLARRFLCREAHRPAAETASVRIRRPARRVLALRAWMALSQCWLLLKVFGFRGLHRLAQSEAAVWRIPPPEAGPELLFRAEEAFLAAENLFLLKEAPQDCLPRSMAVFLFLRRLGLPARHHIGVERYPITMHAWAECDGRPVLDDPDAPRMTTLSTTPA